MPDSDLFSALLLGVALGVPMALALRWAGVRPPWTPIVAVAVILAAYLSKLAVAGLLGGL
jgi:hypothetical protein